MVDEKSVDAQETQRMYVISMPEGILNIVLKLVNETPMARMVSDAVLNCIGPQIREQNKNIDKEPVQKSTTKKKRR